MSYFAIESNTGAINGFYAYKDDLIDSTERMLKKYPGTTWFIGESIKKMGVGRTFTKCTYTQDFPMQEKLKEYSDWYSATHQRSSKHNENLHTLQTN